MSGSPILLGDVDESTEDEDQQDTDNTKHKKTCRDTLWLPVVSVLLLVSLVSNVCVCWKRKKYRKG